VLISRKAITRRCRRRPTRPFPGETETTAGLAYDDGQGDRATIAALTFLRGSLVLGPEPGQPNRKKRIEIAAKTQRTNRQM
jgi:hypothetical protein